MNRMDFYRVQTAEERNDFVIIEHLSVDLCVKFVSNVKIYELL